MDMNEKRVTEVLKVRVEPKQASLPKCGGCSLVPLPIAMHEVNGPRGLILGIMACAECGHVVQVLVTGMTEAQIVDGKGRPLSLVKQ